MLSVPDFGRRTYFTLLAALTVAGACAWGVGAAVLRPDAAFALAWAVMTLAVLLPSAAPMVATYTSLRHEAAGGRGAYAGAVAFVAGYVLTWSAVGSVAAVFARASAGAGAGRYAVAAALALAAAYELTPVKRRCLAACRVPLSFVLRSWRDGAAGALDMGARYGLRCVGACGGLVTAVFAIAPRELRGLVAVAGLVGAQKLAPGRTLLIRATALALLVAAVAVALAGPPA